jgi:hypothetical protein
VGLQPHENKQERRGLQARALPPKLHSRPIDPGPLPQQGRNDLTLDGNHFTCLDKPPPTLKGDWSRTENFILDHDHIRFEEYESTDEGKTWAKTRLIQLARTNPSNIANTVML